jgi:diaminopimelate epimerase
MSFQFFKYSATGNDFILVEDFENSANKTPEFVKKLCNRNFGVGADGVLFVQKNNGKFFMNLINSDGSSAKMCGNGIRIVAKHLFDKKLISQKTFEILTPSGSKTVSLSIKNDLVSSVVVNMGRAEFIGKKTFFDKSFIILSMGNPHAVTFLPSFEKAWISKVAPKIESDQFFPDRTNVEFVQILSKNEIRLIVFERGAGFTLACGTVVVNMGRAEFIGKKTFFDKSFIILSMGNPHAVTFLPSFEKAWISKVAPKIESDQFFPDRTNVEFVQILSKNEIRLIVFERGAGFTLACGTGACASIASAAKNGLIEFDKKITVNLPGGKLFITVLADYSVIMEGDATLVFSATADDSIYGVDNAQ